MKKFVQSLTIGALALGVLALSANAQTQKTGAAALQALKNATPITRQAACNGRTGRCGCGPGWVSACANRCCRCVPC